jgi:hypothetical protein
MKRLILACAGLAAGLLAGGSGFGSVLAASPPAPPPQSVADLVKGSHDIVVGTVVRVTEGREGYVPYTEVEMSVSETLRGRPARTLTFRQIGLQAPQPVESGRRSTGQAPGMPQYIVGESVVLFLGPLSSDGFRTTVGLQQGKFTVQAGKVANALDNSGLFIDVTAGSASLTAEQRAMLATRQGGVDARTFIDFVRQGVQQRWWK